MAYAFQTRIELECADGFYPRSDLSTYQSDDFELRLGDLHYRDVREYAVGRNTSAGWQERRDATNDPLPVTRVWTDFLPQQEVERVVPARSASSSAWRLSLGLPFPEPKRSVQPWIHCLNFTPSGGGVRKE
ncbi:MULTISPECIES: hypothetical protein [unclassified Mesorhizobium]|uniref:hypothetical protein n=1 Tax=unclassified Mesorhizobium TaxID=325217 RepID=UPI000FCAB50B|nr:MULTISPECIES: hypothetical protein [unclassified Mesorhizobium]RVD30037.1 hypothetical protein EN738_08025 [Mesorhizobium sp. M4B.F.Ca.ET.017.02.2.1]RWB36226.1 MAG: hypothetical protein EOQ41_01265 [Mesorhizobium sp.]RWC97707.1 MAG: hypothetical protein EOS32_02605 [Mesorhizobium sp.]RWF79686.1 MAG: hypothetical protein EOS26_00670 [Mesorhizobium sp.]TGQ09169.1 hypothetical protein EN858_20480 [Mesorhizobium sp. M4B.F.Ca.ET.215.01.1.1]